jgi:hypothetical protein
MQPAWLGELMSTPRNGQHPGYHDPARRLRFDSLASLVSGDRAPSITGGATAMAEVLPRGHSGVRFVVVVCISVLLIWATLYLTFREWRAKYRERTAYGLTEVVPAIDPLAEITPPALDPIVWRDAVQRTRAMLVTVISSNLLGVNEMRQIRTELEQSVTRARTHPETALDELAAIWNTQTDRAGFLFKDSRSASGDRHPRPRILPPRSKNVRTSADQSNLGSLVRLPPGHLARNSVCAGAVNLNICQDKLASFSRKRVAYRRPATAPFLNICQDKLASFSRKLTV